MSHWTVSIFVCLVYVNYICGRGTEQHQSENPKKSKFSKKIILIIRHTRPPQPKTKITYSFTGYITDHFTRITRNTCRIPYAYPKLKLSNAILRTLYRIPRTRSPVSNKLLLIKLLPKGTNARSPPRILN